MREGKHEVRYYRVDRLARSMYARRLRENGYTREEAHDISQLPWHYLGLDIKRFFRRMAVTALRDSRVRKALDSGYIR